MAMPLVSITAAGQRWSATNGWLTPSASNFPYQGWAGRLSLTVMGALANGTVLVLERRLRAEHNNGSPGVAEPVLVIDADAVAAAGKTGFSDDFDGVSTMFEFDLECTNFGAGDVVSVRLI